MDASEIESLTRKIFRVAFRAGENRAERMAGAPQVERLATNKEIDREAAYHIASLIRQEEQDRTIELVHVVEFAKPKLVPNTEV